MRESGIRSLSSSGGHRAAKLLDQEIEAQRNRKHGTVKNLFPDTRYQEIRQGDAVRDAAMLAAIGIGPDDRRRALGTSVALSEAEDHWREFLKTLVARGMRGVDFITSDDHAGLQASLQTARCAVPGGATWQRRHFNLAQKTPFITLPPARPASA